MEVLLDCSFVTFVFLSLCINQEKKKILNMVNNRKGGARRKYSQPFLSQPYTQEIRPNCSRAAVPLNANVVLVFLAKSFFGRTLENLGPTFALGRAAPAITSPVISHFVQFWQEFTCSAYHCAFFWHSGVYTCRNKDLIPVLYSNVQQVIGKGG